MASSSFSAFASILKRLISRSLVLPRRQQLFLGAASARSYSASLSFDPGTPDDAAPQRRVPFQRPLENGLDQGVYTSQGILVGKVGQNPVQRYLRSGLDVVLFSLGTGGIRNNRRPIDNEEPRDYADRFSVQWHRVCVYPDRLGYLALEHVMPGSILYVEGNLETKVFTWFS